MGTAQALYKLIDRFTATTGTLVTWLTLLLIASTCGVVVMRYFLGISSQALQESATYFHACLFMLAIAFTLKNGGHVRVDVFYRGLNPRRQALVDIIGTVIFLFPVCILIFSMSWDYVTNSWAIRETSTESSGLPWIYLLKSLLLIMPALVMLQGLAELTKNLLFFLGRGGSHTEDRLEPI
jgi:TRAP-type mannitol/chloroaromatic compound transport system permease small subunit